MNTTTTDDARSIVRDALTAYAANAPSEGHGDQAALAAAMAGNVRGWTHTTRLRDFLGGLPGQPAAATATAVESA